MSPFQEELYRLIQDARKDSTAFTTAEQDAGNDVQRILKFAQKWDFKQKYEEQSKELDSIKKQYEQDKLALARKATRDILKELIPVIDQLQSLSKGLEESSPGSTLERGIKLILANIEDILTRRKGGVIRPKLGEELDPVQHKAISVEEVAKHIGTTVSEVYRFGYFILGQVVREAEVRVRCAIGNSN